MHTSKSNQRPGPSWQRPSTTTREERSEAARLRIMELNRALEKVKSHYDLDTDPNHTQTTIPLVRALRDLAEAWGEFGNYQEQGKLESYQKQKKLLEEALKINRKGADPIETAETLHKLGNANYNLKDLQEAEKCYKEVLDINERISPIDDAEAAEISNNLGSVYHALGDYPKAKKIFELILPLFEELSDHIKVATILNNLGKVYRDLENPQKAKELFEEALLSYEKVYGPDHIEVGRILNNLGNADYFLENFEKAKGSHERALPIYEKFYGSDHVEVAEVLNNLGDDYYALENYQEAKESYEKELAIRKRHHDSYTIKMAKAQKKDHQKEKGLLTEIAKTSHDLGDTYRALKNYRKAEESFKRALAIEKNYPDKSIAAKTSKKLEETLRSLIKQLHGTLAVKKRNYPPDHLQIGQTLRELADAYGGLEDYQNQKESLEGALAIEEKHYGPDDVRVAKTLHDLGNTYRALKNYRKAGELYEKELVIYKKDLVIKERRYGPNSVEVAEILRHLGNGYYNLYDFQKAKESYEKELEIEERHYGHDNAKVAKTLYNLGDTYHDLEDYQKAKEPFKKALAIVEKNCGPGHPSVAKISEKLQETLRALIKQLHKTLAEKERNYPPDNFQIGQTLRELADAYGELKDYQKQKELLERALAIYEKLYGFEHIDVAKILNSLGSTYRALGDNQKAKESLERASAVNRIQELRKTLAEKERNYPPDNFQIGQTLGELADAYGGLKDYQKQKELLERVLAIYEKHYGPDNPIVAKTSEKLQGTLRALIKQLRETLAEKERNYSPGHLQIGQTLRELADAYGGLKDYQNQKESLERALPILKESFGDTNPTIARMLKDLGDAYKGLKNTQKAQQLHKEASVVEGKNEQIALDVQNRNLKARENPVISPYTSLLVAAKGGDLSLVKHLIEKKGADVNEKDRHGSTPLHLAAEEGRLGVIEYLISKGANLNAIDNSGDTPLYLAIQRNQLPALIYLLEGGAKVDINNSNSITFLHRIILNGQLDIVKYLIKEEIVGINKKDEQGNTLLNLAAGKGGFDMVEYLVEQGASVNIAGENGSTSLHLAAKRGRLNIIEYLVSKGANLNAIDNLGDTPLHLALKHDKAEASVYLVEQGADVNIAGENGSTPLHRAISTWKNNYRKDSNLDVIKLLIEKGANTKATDNENHTPLHLAAQDGYWEAASILLRNSANVNDLSFSQKQKLFSHAQRHDYKDIITLLFPPAPKPPAPKPRSPNKCLISRRRREIDNCHFSWEDIDEFNEEKEDVRNPSKIRIGEEFVNYIKDLPEEKRESLIQLAGQVEVTGKFQGLINKLINNQKVISHLNRVERISGAAMYGMMGKAVVADIFNGDYGDAAFNIGFIAGGHGFAKVAEAVSMRGAVLASDGKLLLGRSLGAAAPFLARGASGFVIYDLVKQVGEYRKGNNDSLIGIVGDSVYIGVDAAGIGVEIAEAFEVFAGVSSITGPIGATIGVLAIFSAETYRAIKQVGKINEFIRLTGGERFIEGLRAFIGMKPEQHIEELMEEKEANNLLVRQGIEYLKQHGDIQRYIFPTGKLIAGSHKLQADLDNTVLFDEKTTSIKLSRAKPDDPEEGKLLCSPEGDDEQVPSNVAYLCKDAIGIESSTNKTGNYTFIDLGEGNDYVKGFPSSPNIIRAGNGDKRLNGGDKDDVFILQGDNVKGYVDGGNGTDTVDLGGFAPKTESLSIDLNESRIGNLSVTQVERVLAREDKQDLIYCDVNTKYVDGRGGKDNGVDAVIIPSKDLPYELQVVARPNTVIHNNDAQKESNFTYIAPKGEGEVLINLKSNESKHNFLFDYAVSDLESIDVRNIDNTVTFNFVPPFSAKDINDIVEYTRSINIIKRKGTAIGEVVFNFDFVSVEPGDEPAPTITKTVNIPSVVSALSPYYREMNSEHFNVTISNKHAMLSAIRTMTTNGALGEENRERFNVTITGVTNNAAYKLNDATEIKIGNKGNLYAIQSSNRSADEIISDYPTMANRLKMSIFVQSILSNATVAVGHDNHDVLYNNPRCKSHLIGNGGENIFVITSGHETLDETKLPIPEVVIHDVDKENLIDTLDLRQIREQIRKDLGKDIEARTSMSSQDLLIELFHPNATQSIVTVRLKNALVTNWHERLQVILNYAPMKIEEFDLKPVPLVLTNDKEIIVITPRDIEKEGKLVISKKAGNYIFARSENDLIITNSFDSNLKGNEFCTIFLANFYHEPKMQTLTVKFADTEVLLKNEMSRIGNATSIDYLKDQLSNDFVLNHNSTATNSRTRKRRDISATSGARRPSSWINTVASAATRGIATLGNFIFSSTKTLLPATQIRNSTLPQSPGRDNSITALTPNIDVDGTIFLLDVFIRKITGQKYVSSIDSSTSLLEARADALNITTEFEQVLKDTAVKSSVSATNLNFNLVEVQSAIVGQIVNGKHSEIPEILYSAAKDACPEFKQTDKFLAHLVVHLKAETSSINNKPATLTMQSKKKLPSHPVAMDGGPSTSLDYIKTTQTSSCPGGTILGKHI